MVLLTVLLAASIQAVDAWAPASSPRLAEALAKAGLPLVRSVDAGPDSVTWHWLRIDPVASADLTLVSLRIQRDRTPNRVGVERAAGPKLGDAGQPNTLPPRLPSNLPLGLGSRLYLGSGNIAMIHAAGPQGYLEIVLKADKQGTWTSQDADHLQEITERLSRWCLAEYEGSLLTAADAGWISAEGERHFPAKVWADAKGFACTTDADGICRIAAPAGQLVLAAGSSVAVYAGERIELPSIIYARDGEVLIPAAIAMREDF